MGWRVPPAAAPLDADASSASISNASAHPLMAGMEQKRTVEEAGNERVNYALSRETSAPTSAETLPGD